MKIRLLVLVAAFAAGMVVYASAAKGSCISKAKSLSGSQAVTLVAEYDPEEKETYDEGVMYYSVTLSRGQAYTIWIEGGNAAEMDLDINTNDDYYDKEKNEDKEPGASFNIESLDGGAIQYGYLYSDDWTLPEAGDEKGDYDPKQGKYIVSISGNIGARTTLYFMKGIKNFTIPGSEESPKAVTFANKWKSFSGKLIDGEYYFRATLKAGTKYRVRTLGGTVESPLGLDIDDGTDESEDSQETSETIDEDSEFSSDTKNEAFVIVPDENSKYGFVVNGDDTQSFKFLYRSVPQRKIGSHPAIPLLEENGFSATFTPGRMSSSENYYDDIVDEHLCKIYLKKGERWVFETEGATAYQKMYAYSTAGKVLSTNEGLDGVDGEDLNTRVVITASASGIYYIGVCDPTLDIADKQNWNAEKGVALVEGDEGWVAPIKVTGRNVTEYIVPDEFDPKDDVASGANWLVPYPGTTNDFAVSVTMASDDVYEAAKKLGSVHSGHRLNPNDIYDVFAIACRKGFTYRLNTTWSDTNETSRLSLGASVFYLAGTKERPVTTVGSLSPESDIDLEFTPTVSGVHYVRVYVAEGTGLDFPGYNVHAMVANGTNALGYVQANMDGGVGTWSFNTESYTYPSGAVVAMRAGVNATVKFNAVTGFTASPATAAVVSLPVWAPGVEPLLVTSSYSDNYDKKYQTGTVTTVNKKTGKKVTTAVYSPETGDATPEGAFAITPATTSATVKRTLWENDPADCFKFTAAAGVYYNFTLTGPTNFSMVVSNAVDGVVAEAEPLADGTGICLSKTLLPAGVSYVIITRGMSEVGAAYVLTHSRASTGTVQFVMPTTKVKVGKTTKTVPLTYYSAKEGSQYVSLTVSRTGKEGIVRVRYSTQAMDVDEAVEEFASEPAQPGTNYYPVIDGEIKWAANDKANKTIKIPLIPDPIANWSASNKVFSVKLYPVDEYELGSGEYLARTNAVLSTAVVKILEANAAKPGTLALVSCGESSVLSASKPVVSAQAGRTNTFTFARTGGTDGVVKLKVATTIAKGNTARANVDFLNVMTNLVWESGDSEPKTVEIYMPTTTTYAASKNFTLSMTAVKGTHVASLAAKSATITILSDVVKQTAADYAKTIPASSGLKLTSTGTWFKGDDGVLRSAPASGILTYTLTGPGYFRCQPQVVVADSAEDSAVLTCKFDKEAAIPCDGEAVVRILGPGKHTVQFAISAVTGSAYATFEPQIDGAPYCWIPLTATATSPMNKAAVVAVEQSSLSWTVPAEVAGLEGVYWRVRMGTSTKSLSPIAYGPANTSEVELEETLAEGGMFYWAVDYAYTDVASPDSETLATLSYATGATWSFSTVKDGAPRTSFDADAVDATGTSVNELLAAGEPLELIQAVKVALQLEGEGTNTATEAVTTANAFRLVAGALPKGITVSSAGALAGTPSTVGESTVLLQSGVKTTKITYVTTNGKKVKKTTTSYSWNGTTQVVTIKVIPAGTALGTFRAVVEEDGSVFSENARRFGQLTLSVTSAGKLTAKTTIGGVSYTFTGTGYDEILERDESAPGCTRQFRTKLTNTTLINKKTKTYNYLTLTVKDGALTNGVALAELVGDVELEMNVANVAKTSVVKDIVYRGQLYRDNGATELAKAGLAKFGGYYTVGLVPESVTAEDGVPYGNGYLTFTVGSTGAVKVSGVLADGTSVSYSTFGQLIGDDLSDPKSCKLAIPVFVGKTTVYAVSGVAEIGYEYPEDETAVPVLLPVAKIYWAKSAAASASKNGAGFCLSLAPTGGWYDKTVNLQNYYLGKGFALSTVETGDELPTYALAKGYSFTTASTPHNLGMSFVGNALKVDAKKLVKTTTTGLYDTWQQDPSSKESVSASVNPWSVVVKYTRSTGLISGTLSAWEWVFKFDEAGIPYATAQKEIKSLVHKGVWLYSRDSSSESPLPDTAASAGFFLMSGAKSWKASLPFNVLVTSDEEPTWNEKDLGSAD